MSETRSETLWLLNCALALVMFGIALEISLKDFKRLFRQTRPVVTGIVSQFVLLPLITFLLVVAISPLPSIALGMARHPAREPFKFTRADTMSCGVATSFLLNYSPYYCVLCPFCQAFVGVACIVHLTQSYTS